MGARNFDGFNDNISFGSDASVDDYTSQTILVRVGTSNPGVGQNWMVLAKSDGNDLTPTGWQFKAEGGAGEFHLRFSQDFTVTDGAWVTPNNSMNENFLPIAVTYNRNATGNDPIIYINGTSQALTEVGAPAGASNGDAAQNLRAGEDDGGGQDYFGSYAFLVRDNTILTAADVNRHRWWGVAPGGPSTVDVWHPMWTDSLTNKGTATANGTATGTDMNPPPGASVAVERCWGSMMGCGR